MLEDSYEALSDYDVKVPSCGTERFTWQEDTVMERVVTLVESV